MLQMQAHGQYRNLDENALQGVEIAKDNIFYGLNGAGKSTICDAIASSTIKIKNLENGEEIHRIYAFNKHWVEEKVGEFVRGGNAPGITTVVLGEESQNALNSIKKLEKELEELAKEQQVKIAEQDNARKAQQEIIDGIFDGSRKQYMDCPILSNRAFNRGTIKKIVSNPNNQPELLSLEEFQEYLEVAKATEIPTLPLLPESPTIEELGSEELGSDVWDYLRKPLHFKEVVKSITKWAEEGLKLHSAGENCQFCGNLVTENRINDLNEAISKKLELRPAYIMRVENYCETHITALREYWQRINGMNFAENVYTKDLILMKESLLNEVTLVETRLRELVDLLQKKNDDSEFTFDNDPIDIPIRVLKESISGFEEAYSKAEKAISEHKQNHEHAKRALHSHFCAADCGLEWIEKENDITAIDAELKEIKGKTRSKTKEITDLRASVSGIHEVAEFIDEKLKSILGDDSLSVSVSARKEEGYRIIRRGDSAKDMSEGEKKLIALLYFFAELRQEDVKKNIGKAIVLLDDIGSEFDDSRIFHINRFISRELSNKSKPLATLYFTHSFSFFRLLTGRLSRKITDKESKKARVFEVFKKNLDPDNFSTCVSEWDEQSLKFQNDYHLSFFLVLQAFKQIASSKSDRNSGQSYLFYGIGNYCRKTIEAFTEFYYPMESEFGSRLNNICTEFGLTTPVDLGRLTNDASHSSLDRGSPIFSYTTLEHTVMRTLAFIKAVDERHFNKMLEHLLGKEESKNLQKQISALKF